MPHPQPPSAPPPASSRPTVTCPDCGGDGKSNFVLVHVKPVAGHTHRGQRAGSAKDRIYLHVLPRSRDGASRTTEMASNRRAVARAA
jgi:hypothetical protein